MIGLRMYIEIVVRDKNGKIFSRSYAPSRSMVANFLRWFRCWMTMTSAAQYGTPYTMIDTLNNNETFPYLSTSAMARYGFMGALLNATLNSIVFGTGNTPVNPNDHVIETLITGGSGAGQLTQDATSLGAVTINGQDSAFSFARTAHNQSGNTITVKEVGIYLALLNAGGGQKSVLIVRDVLTTPTVIPNGSSMTATYIVKVTA